MHRNEKRSLLLSSLQHINRLYPSLCWRRRLVLSLLKPHYKRNEVRSFLFNGLEIVGNDLRPIRKTIWAVYITNKVCHWLCCKNFLIDHGLQIGLEMRNYMTFSSLYSVVESNKLTEVLRFVRTLQSLMRGANYVEKECVPGIWGDYGTKFCTYLIKTS